MSSGDGSETDGQQERQTGCLACRALSSAMLAGTGIYFLLLSRGYLTKHPSITTVDTVKGPVQMRWPRTYGVVGVTLLVCSIANWHVRTLAERYKWLQKR